jgi:TPR repeat protein
MGDMYAHCYWADSDKDHYDKHLELGAQADDAFAKYCYAFHLNKLAQSDAEKQHALDLIEKAAELGEASACTFVYYQYMYGSSICTVDKEQAAYWIKKPFAWAARLGAHSYGRMLLDEPGRKEEGITLPQARLHTRRGIWPNLARAPTALLRQHARVASRRLCLDEGGRSIGHKPAMDKLATAYRTGKGCPEDAQASHCIGCKRGRP